MTNPVIGPAKDREFRSKYRGIAARLHIASFELAGLMHAILGLYERHDRATAGRGFMDYVGKSFGRIEDPRLPLSGSTRKQYLLMAQEYRRLVKSRGEAAAARFWNDTGGWPTIAVLSGLSEAERGRAERLLDTLLRERGIGFTSHTARHLLKSNRVRTTRKIGPERVEDRAAFESRLRAEVTDVIRRLILAGLKAPKNRTAPDEALLTADPAKLTEACFRKAGRRRESA